MTRLHFTPDNVRPERPVPAEMNAKSVNNASP